MKLEILNEIIQKKSSSQNFALLTNLTNGNSEIFEFGKLLSIDFENYKKQIAVSYTHLRAHETS